MPLPTSSVHAREAALDRIIVALDFPSADDALGWLDRFAPGERPRWVKVGLELFLAEGSPLVRRLREQGYSVFLDLKLHDIPQTVASAVRVLGTLDVALLTLHAAGGRAMMEAAVEAAAGCARPPRLLAVTVLTSLDEAQLAATGVVGTPAVQVEALGRLAWSTGVRGLVASPAEAASLRAGLGEELHLVTPGIRGASAVSVADDQKRTASPAQALRAGASQLVIGRPITRAADPVGALAAIVREVEDALG